MSWWKDAGAADTRWEVEDGERLRRSCGKADGGTGTGVARRGGRGRKGDAQSWKKGEEPGLWLLLKLKRQ